MSVIKIHALKPGMTLAEAINNHSGRKLFSEGTELTVKHIINLKAWGVTEANITDKDGGLEPTLELEEIDPQKMAVAQKEAMSLFRHSNQEHPAVAELMHLFCLKRLQKQGEG
jgi:hypothetical protein